MYLFNLRIMYWNSPNIEKLIPSGTADARSHAAILQNDKKKKQIISCPNNHVSQHDKIYLYASSDIVYGESIGSTPQLKIVIGLTGKSSMSVFTCKRNPFTIAVRSVDNKKENKTSGFTFSIL